MGGGGGRVRAKPWEFGWRKPINYGGLTYNLLGTATRAHKSMQVRWEQNYNFGSKTYALSVPPETYKL